MDLRLKAVNDPHLIGKPVLKLAIQEQAAIHASIGEIERSLGKEIALKSAISSQIFGELVGHSGSFFSELVQQIKSSDRAEKTHHNAIENKHYGN